MELKRGSLNNIIESGRYRSAIITSYTFDPFFVRHIFTPILHSKRIRNITMMVDQQEMAKVLREEENLSALSDTSFVLLPAQSNMLFHPKIMLFVGPKEGLCLIGSGNLTHSGLGGNDEIWGAFHINESNRVHASVFREVWNFIQLYTPELTGSAELMKQDWILNYAPWLREILSTPTTEQPTTSVLTNTAERTIWDHITERFSDTTISGITVASPFYDENGTVLKELRKTFPEAQINMIYDEYGTIPRLSEHVDKLDCYSWQKLNGKSETSRRLHAKFLLFKDNLDNEYILFGSANATDSAMGVAKPAHATNAELSLLGKPEETTLSEQLIKAMQSIDATDIQSIEVNPATLPEPSYSFSANGLRIIYAEQIDSEVTAVLNKTPEGKSVTVKLFDQLQKEIPGVQLTNTVGNVVTCSLPKAKDDSTLYSAAYIGLEDQKARMLVYHNKRLSVNNPDPRTEKLRNVLSDLEAGNFEHLHDQLIKVLTLATEDTDSRESRQLKVSSSSKEDSGEQSEDITSQEFYSKEEFTERDAHHKRSVSDSYKADLVLESFRAMNRIIFSGEIQQASEETQQSDSSEEYSYEAHMQDDDNHRKNETISERKKQIRGFRSFFKRSFKYFDRYIDALNENNNPDKPDFDRLFVVTWLFTNQVAVNLILKEAKDKNDASYKISKEEDVSFRNTILPYDSKELSIHDIVFKLVSRIVAHLNKAKVDLTSYLDRKERIEGAVTLVILLCLKHWKTADLEKQEKLYRVILSVFELSEGEAFQEFIKSLAVYASTIKSELRENERIYYKSFCVSLERIWNLNP